MLRRDCAACINSRAILAPCFGGTSASLKAAVLHASRMDSIAAAPAACAALALASFGMLSHIAALTSAAESELVATRAANALRCSGSVLNKRFPYTCSHSNIVNPTHALLTTHAHSSQPTSSQPLAVLLTQSHLAEHALNFREFDGVQVHVVGKAPGACQSLVNRCNVVGRSYPHTFVCALTQRPIQHVEQSANANSFYGATAVVSVHGSLRPLAITHSLQCKKPRVGMHVISVGTMLRDQQYHIFFISSRNAGGAVSHMPAISLSSNANNRATMCWQQHLLTVIELQGKPAAQSAALPGAEPMNVAKVMRSLGC